MPVNHIQIDMEPICDKCHWGIAEKCFNRRRLDGTFWNRKEYVEINCYYSEEEYQREDNP